MHDHFASEPGAAGAPSAGRVYARVEEVVDGRVRLEAVDADWQDAVGDGPWRQDSAGARDTSWPVSVLDISEGQLSGAHASQWWELHVQVDHGSDFGQWFPFLFGGGEGVSIESAVPAGNEGRRQLLSDLGVFRRQTAVAGLEQAFVQQLADGGGQVPEAVGVHNVGQGTAASVIFGGEPALWVDVGGGCLGHTSTWPEDLNGLCVAGNPSVVLTHWDCDHWSAAERTPALLDVPWLAPSQPLGPQQRAFMLKLSNLTRVGSLPPGGISNGWLEVTRPAPKVKSKNNSGLVVRVRGPKGETMLLPGDARYRAAEVVHAVVASHHGGATGSAASKYPSPSQGHCGAGALVYSYGQPNQWHHPLQASASAYHGVGWCDVCQEFDTPNGNVHVYWDVSDPDIAPGCGSACCAPTQRSHCA